MNHPGGHSTNPSANPNGWSHGGGRPRTRVRQYELSPEQTPNYLFASWLREWYEEAANRDSRLQFAYRKALEGMIRWPERLRTGREAGRIPGIGPSISARLEARLVEYNQTHGIIRVPEGIVDISNYGTQAADESADGNSAAPATRKPRAKQVREYVPTLRSGPYAMLVALLVHVRTASQSTTLPLSLSRTDLVRQAQPFCTTALNEGHYPVANGALRVLENRGLLVCRGIPVRVALTRQGLVLAEQLWLRGECPAGTQSDPPPPLSPAVLARLQAEEGDGEETFIDAGGDSREGRAAHGNHADPTGFTPELTLFTWAPGSFELVLLVDVREIKSREERNYLQERLLQLGILAEVRNLALGDFVWIARRRRETATAESDAPPSLADEEEIVLDTLVERKREDDLAASIGDGRFSEQRHRIARSLLANTFYLVERPPSGTAGDFLPGGAAILQAATLKCQVVDGMMCRHTAGLEDTIAFLATLHQTLQRRFGEDGLSSCVVLAAQFNCASFSSAFLRLRAAHPDRPVLPSYTAYALLNSKSANQSRADVFLRQLMTVRGVSFSIALALLGQFPTPMHLHRFYRQPAGHGNPALALRDVAVQGRRIGPALSTRIYSVFGVVE